MMYNQWTAGYAGKITQPEVCNWALNKSSQTQNALYIGNLGTCTNCINICRYKYIFYVHFLPDSMCEWSVGHSLFGHCELHNMKLWRYIPKRFFSSNECLLLNRITFRCLIHWYGMKEITCRQEAVHKLTEYLSDCYMYSAQYVVHTCACTYMACTRQAHYSAKVNMTRSHFFSDSLSWTFISGTKNKSL